MEKITKSRLFNILTSRHLDTTYDKLSKIPSPLLLKDIEKGAKRIKEAIEKNQRITVVGDYDVDGVVSTVIMIDFFNQINYPISYIIPNRFNDGYGISASIIDKLDTDVIITVDNGISAIEAGEVCKEKGITLIITDHHRVGDKLPEAYAIINPKQDDCDYPFKEICGAQVAWYLCGVIKKELNLNIDMGSFLDLLSIAIIADVMPLVSLNYTMVKNGLLALNNSKRASILELKRSISKKNISSSDIGFNIAPKLNSAGRMEDASIALNFLLEPDIINANHLLAELSSINDYRKEVQSYISTDAIKQVGIDDDIIVVWDNDWHEGIVGIVASYLSHKFKKPAFVLSITDNIAKGSARSTGDVNLYDLLKLSEDLLLKYGGHKSAAGLSLESKNLQKFKEEINKNIKTFDCQLHIEEPILGEIDIREIDLELIRIIEQFEPYGMGNRKPIFKISGAKLISYGTMGHEKKHLKLLFQKDLIQFEAISFNTSYQNHWDILDLVVNINKNEFRGKISPQILIQNLN